MKKLITAALLAMVTSTSQALTLDAEQSSLHFVTVKNDKVGEVMTFSSLSGDIDGDQATLKLNLDSVQSNIDIRNERMRSMLFETQQFPELNVSVKLPADVVDDLVAGDSLTMDLSASIDLHGINKDINFSAQVIALNDGGVRVISAQPIIINAVDFGLDVGVAKLQEVAKLAAIALAVPVTFDLVYTP
jgi:polyisoprenoid-binding protein YceI